MIDGSQSGVQSLEVGIALFRVLLQFGRAASLTEIAEGAQMQPGKAHRYLVSLNRCGLVAQDGRGQYRLGPFVAQIGSAGAGPQTALEVASRGLEELAESLKQTAFLSMWAVSGPQVVRVAEAQTPVSLRPTTRGELPLWNSATSRIFLSYMEPARVEELLTAESKRDREIYGTSNVENQRRRKLVHRELVLARQHGVARTTGERQPGLVSFAAPIFTGAPHPALAVTVIAIEAAISSDWNGPAAKAVREFAAAVTHELRGHAP